MGQKKKNRERGELIERDGEKKKMEICGERKRRRSFCIFIILKKLINNIMIKL